LPTKEKRLHREDNLLLDDDGDDDDDIDKDDDEKTKSFVGLCSSWAARAAWDRCRVRNNSRKTTCTILLLLLLLLGKGLVL
jgi:hypothetical protein